MSIPKDFNLTDDNIYKSKVTKDIDTNIRQLLKTDAKFYGKIHFDRNRSDNEQNMHCHLIVSRKDQSNKKKLSPLTNHKNTKKGKVTGGFDRVNLFQHAEQGFDKLLEYNRQQAKSFDYQNMMKNSPIFQQLKLQEEKFQTCERKIEKKRRNLSSINLENMETNNQFPKLDTLIGPKEGNNTSHALSFNKKTIEYIARVSLLFHQR